MSVMINVAALYGQHCITTEDGEDLNKRICSALEHEKDGANLNFHDVKVFASPFFNAMVGTLLRDYTPEDLNKLVVFTAINGEGLDLLRRVIVNSREYFSNPKVRAKLDELNADPDSRA